MKNHLSASFLSLIAVCLTFSALTPYVQAQAKTTVYTGFIGNDSIRLTIHWTNYGGNDAVSGSYQWQGTTYTFTGLNYAPGQLRLTDSVGDVFVLSKANSANTIGWRGSSPTWGGQTVTFTRPK